MLRSGLCAAPGSLAVEQRALIGNHVMAQRLQAKLKVNSPGDQYEQEADRVADQVMRMTVAPSIQRKCRSREEEGKLQRKCAQCEEEEEKVQRQEAGAGPAVAPPVVNQVISSPGIPLDAGTRAFMEPRFGHDFSQVRIHADTKASESAHSVNALAYTVGQDVVFGEHQYSPGTTEGRRLLAHELAHVVQQGGEAKADAAGLAMRIRRLQRKIGDGHDLTSPRFAGDRTLEACYDDEARLTKGARGESVRKIQQALIDLGYNLGPCGADGKFGDFTWNAVKKFKKNEGLGWEHMGDVGPGTMGRLDKLFPSRTGTLPPKEPPHGFESPLGKESPAPSPARTCGPDITSALSAVLGTVGPYFDKLSKWKKRRSCMVLDLDASLAFVNPFMAWDIRQLFLRNTGWLDRYFRSRGCGSPRDAGCATDPERKLCETPGSCGNSVMVGGRCMLAGTANYALYGRMFKLCNDELSPDYPRWDMKAMIWLWKVIPDDPGPPLAMATAVFDGKFPSAPAAAENRASCTGRCGVPHTGSFDFIWEPYRSR